MSELSERSKELSEQLILQLMEMPTLTYFDGFIREAQKTLVPLIAQALLAERRLAMEEAAKMVEDSSCKDHGADCMLPARKKCNEIAAKLRAAAEKATGKLATPRGGE